MLVRHLRWVGVELSLWRSNKSLNHGATSPAPSSPTYKQRTPSVFQAAFKSLYPPDKSQTTSTMKTTLPVGTTAKSSNMWALEASCPVRFLVQMSDVSALGDCFLSGNQRSHRDHSSAMKWECAEPRAGCSTGGAVITAPPTIHL